MANDKNNVEVVQETFLVLTEDFLKYGASIHDLRSIIATMDNIKINNNNNSNNAYYIYFKRAFIILLLSTIYALLVKYSYIDNVRKNFYEARCFVPSNYFIWEFTRPISNCDYCRNVDKPIILSNVTKEEFKLYAYSSQPIIIKNAASHWSASKVFSVDFFRNLYEKTEGAYESIEEECQFLHFESDFSSLREVFAMSEERAMNQGNEDPWYIGWKNCHPQILDAMKQFYDVPKFFPDDAEISHTNYIFMGYNQGANMHLDYISRLMWQGQILGNKIWIVAPTPECDNICKQFNFSVDTGDIILLDTRIWYHSTYIENGNFSLTVTSEYGTNGYFVNYYLPTVF
ncbi:hypothetical protein KPH14_002530 [Odynerus spinipes]|uniref:Cupin-like domain-containing protein n=1 Tax=Odynerus spinipes TaxID=1348599 RepID=A0AAD9RSC4_9HYME|nr:hypothetical protein KPH14_002530 [Odynerus spinipes]